jgi:hypothetical protein
MEPSYKAVKLLTQVVQGKLNSYASDLLQACSFIANSPAKHKILMRAYKRSRKDPDAHSDTASVASTNVTGPCEEGLSLVPLKEESRDLSPVKCSPVKVPKLCLATITDVGFTGETQAVRDISELNKRLKLAAVKLQEPVGRAVQAMNRSMNEELCSELAKTSSHKGYGRSYSQARGTTISQARTPKRTKGQERQSSAHRIRRIEHNFKEQFVVRVLKQVQCDCDAVVRTLPNETWKSENGPRVRGSAVKLPYETELFEILIQISSQKIKEVRDTLRHTPEATEIGLALMILFADVDNSIEIPCSHKVVKSRRWEQVSNYFSVPGHVVSVCRRFIPNVKKGLVSLNAVQQARDQIAQVKRARDPTSAYALLQSFIVKAIQFFEAWQQQSFL